ncbi:MAG TPA: ATPase, partial [Firmicutes bacterium]|nr:ATPase [Bacillota bacterium]
PTDGALLMAAAKGGLTKDRLLERFEVIREYPFESRTKMMSVVVRDLWTGSVYAFVKGAPEVILSRCSFIQGQWGPAPFGTRQRAGADNICRQWAGEAYRLLAVAWKECKLIPLSQQEAASELIFSGITALNDPPRPQVPEA